MTKALLKKQMREVFAWVYRNRKTGQNRSGKGLVGYILLYLVLFAYLGYLFYIMGDALCAPLTEAGFGWLYMALMGLVGVALGVFGSVFNTYTSLYQAKDNDLLLSMPIRPSRILMARLSGVYMMGLMYELIVMVPAVIVFFLNTQTGIAGILFTLLLPFVLSFFVLTLSCILGFFVALIAGRLKNAKIVTVALCLLFLAAYYYFYMKAFEMLQGILADPAGLAGAIRGTLYPFYHMGLAAGGNAVSMLIFTAIVAVLLGVVVLVLSRSFLSLVTRNRGEKRVRVRQKAIRAGSGCGALLRKELRRFMGSTTYMLNCGLGIVLMVVAAAALVIKAADVRVVMAALFGPGSGMAALLAVAALCMMVSMNDLTAPSVSLEGKNLWIVQVFPVKPAQVLYAKLKLHLLLTLIPAALLTAAALVVLQPEPVYFLLIPVAVGLFAVLMGLVGLCLGLKMPNLSWTDETVPVKQSLSVMLTLFGGWVIVLGLGGLYFAVAQWIAPAVYLGLASVLLAGASAVLFGWLRTRGAAIFRWL